ncbi:MAG: hypothetical protein H6828_02855 [Planctomycetes bacterium]|nr:hypothetical protein [Planctomycetota bacterium]
MLRRISALLAARLRAQLGGELVPFAALLSQGALVAALCLMVRADLGPFGYALFVLAAAAALLALTLLGEFGALLGADPAAEWVRTLPARDWERRAAHVAAVLVLLTALTVGLALPAAVFAPASVDLGGRLLLVAAALGQALALGAALLVTQALLGERAQGALLLAQIGLVVLGATGLLRAPSLAPLLADLESGRAAWPAWTPWFVPAWYAGAAAPAPPGATLPPSWVLVLGTLAALALLVLLPPAAAKGGRRARTWMALLLAPARVLARKVWVQRRERASFELVYDALPLEREFVLRTYPMVGLPLAFLVAGTRGEGGEGLLDLLALLLFTPAVYLPVLLAHVPVTSSPGARWLLESAPTAPDDVAGGAIKALAVRFLLPLYLALGALAWFLADAGFALRLALPGGLLSLLALRVLYPRCVVGAPLSVAPEDVEVHHDWTGLLLGLALLLTVAALVTRRYVDTPAETAGLVLALVALEAGLSRRSTRAQRGTPAGPQAAG